MDAATDLAPEVPVELRSKEATEVTSYASYHIALLGRFFRGIAVIVLMGGLICSSAHAGPPTDPAAFVDDMITKALGVLNDQDLKEQDRTQKLCALLEEDFDIPRIAKFVLGHYWNSASEEERQTFNKLFEQWMIRGYSAGIADFQGATVRVTGARSSGRDNAIVSSEIIHPNGDSPDRVDWVVRHEEGTFKIINVSVEGVSLVQTGRDEIVSVIDRSGGTVSGANTALEEFLASAE